MSTLLGEGQYTYDIEVAAELYHGQLVENNYNYMLRWADAVDSFFDLMIDWKNSPEAQGGGGRTGEDGDGENGNRAFAIPMGGVITYTDKDGNEAKGRGAMVFIPTSQGDWVTESLIIDTRSSSKYGFYNLLNKYVDGIDKIISKMPSAFDFMISHKIITYIMPYEAVTWIDENGEVKKVGGLHSTMGESDSRIIFSAEHIMGDEQMKYIYLSGVKSQPTLKELFSFEDIILHEHAHAYHYSLAGSDYFNYHLLLHEHFARNVVNQYIQLDGRRTEVLQKQSFWFFRPDWWKYYWRGY